jgi:AraC-like DNA-binding protein
VAEADRATLRHLRADLEGVSEDCWTFFEAMFASVLHTTTVRQLSARLGVLPSTLTSRFYRARLPAPKRYLAFARLIRAARMFENPGLSVANVANHLDYSSPQSFGRHVRALMSITAGEFRQRYNGERMANRFREELVLPHRDKLRNFHPVAIQLRRQGFHDRQRPGIRNPRAG